LGEQLKAYSRELQRLSLWGRNGFDCIARNNKIDGSDTALRVKTN